MIINTLITDCKEDINTMCIYHISVMKDKYNIYYLLISKHLWIIIFVSLCKV